jgi:hypothetical protein
MTNEIPIYLLWMNLLDKLNRWLHVVWGWCSKVYSLNREGATIQTQDSRHIKQIAWTITRWKVFEKHDGIKRGWRNNESQWWSFLTYSIGKPAHSLGRWGKSEQNKGRTSWEQQLKDRCKDYVHELHQSVRMAVGEVNHRGRDALTIITLYRLSKGSTSISRNRTPSVMYRILVDLLLLTSSKRIVYPTCIHNPHCKKILHKVSGYSPRLQVYNLLRSQRDLRPWQQQHAVVEYKQWQTHDRPIQLHIDTVGSLLYIRSRNERMRVYWRVVLPQPVCPKINTTWWCSTA